MKHNFRNDTLEPLHRNTRWDMVKEFALWFVKDVGLFKTFAMFGCFFLTIELLKMPLLFQDALLTQRMSLGEYESGILLVCLFLLVVCLYGFWYMDNVISKALP
jgi:hypothetical protein